MSSTATPISNLLKVQLTALLSSPAISTTAVSGFQVASNAVTGGTDVSFTLTDITGISSVTLLRNNVLDPATATVMQSWQPALLKYTWSDTDTALQAQAKAFYWLLLAPQGASGTPLMVGPQNILLNPQLAAPAPDTSVSASHGAAVNGYITVTVNITGDAASQKIYVSGYKGNGGFVALAQQASSPLQFAVQATGETITIKAIGVSAGGAEAASGPSTTLVLNGVQTVPARPQGVLVNQIATGNQLSFPASRDAGPTYKICRSQRGQNFLLATLLATVTGTAGTIQYLDTGGLSGDWAYYLVATNTAGDSLPSDAASPAVLYTSASVPPNVPANTTNTATIDSVDTGTNALVRVYGPGGVGTSYSRLTGFGSLARPNGTISGLTYATKYCVLWTGTAFAAVTTYPATLADGYEVVGSITTTGPTGASGSGALVDLVIDGTGHVIQANPHAGAVGSGYYSATVSVSGGGGSGAQIQANVDPATMTIPNYTVLDGGSGYATTPTGTVVPGAYGGTTGGGGNDGGGGGSPTGGRDLEL